MLISAAIRLSGVCACLVSTSVECSWLALYRRYLYCYIYVRVDVWRKLHLPLSYCQLQLYAYLALSTGIGSTYELVYTGAQVKKVHNSLCYLRSYPPFLLRAPIFYTVTTIKNRISSRRIYPHPNK